MIKALFWVDDRRRLMPLAIQLGQSPAEAPLIFTPKDERWLWLTARAHLQCADGTYHEIVARLARTHLFVDTFWVAACRTLPAQHPGYALLRPHFTGTIAINNAACTTLIVPGGPIDESIAVDSEGSLDLVAREYAQWSFEQLDPIAQIESRGVIDPNLLPGYHYRDDALALYQGIPTYVADLLRVFYASDDEIGSDEELQAWVRELASAEGGRVKGLPLQDGGLRRFEDLHRIIAQLLFVCSVGHAAVNNGQCDGVVAHLDLLTRGHGQAFVTEDFGAEALDRLLREQGHLPQRTALEIGVALYRALGALHRRGVIHQDISPATSFGARSAGCSSSPTWMPARASGRRHCSWSRRRSRRGPRLCIYMAPEQAGRMNRPVDLRADLYGAGVVLYELLAGVPPFLSDDPKELIHAHLARQPPDLSARVPDLHPSLPAVVHKLLQKNPEALYGSAEGFGADLQRCLDELRTDQATLFPLGTRDRSGRFALPDRLYGREAEIRTLVAALEACGAGERQCLLVAGYSGVGKSALIGEVQLPLAARRGWFCPGKFDQFRRDLPYLAWREALASLICQVLAQPEACLRALGAELHQGLAGNEALITELVPGAEALLGDRVAPPDVSPAEAQARFDQTLGSTLRVPGQGQHRAVRLRLLPVRHDHRQCRGRRGWGLCAWQARHGPARAYRGPPPDRHNPGRSGMASFVMPRTPCVSVPPTPWTAMTTPWTPATWRTRYTAAPLPTMPICSRAAPSTGWPIAIAITCRPCSAPPRPRPSSPCGSG